MTNINDEKKHGRNEVFQSDVADVDFGDIINNREFLVVDLAPLQNIASDHGKTELYLTLLKQTTKLCRSAKKKIVFVGNNTETYTLLTALQAHPRAT